jgi:hypothetical protein
VTWSKLGLRWQTQPKFIADPLPLDAVMPTITELPTDIILSVLTGGMFAAVARGTLSTELLRKWSSSATGMGLSPRLVAWVDLAQSLFITKSIDSQTAMRDTSLGWEGQILAALHVANDDATRPAELLTAHVCWVNTLRNIGKSVLPTDDIEYLVTVGWQRLSERPFLSKMPLTTVPDLKRACASNEHGWRKVGEVLAAAQYVCGARDGTTDNAGHDPQPPCQQSNVLTDSQNSWSHATLP